MAEKEYIEREAFIEILKKTKKDCEHYADKVVCDFAIRMVNLMPPADVQEVVRCSNCIHICLHSSGYYYCSVTGKEYKGYELGYNFCSYGERICGAKMDKE